MTATSAEPPPIFATLEGHLGIDDLEIVRSEAALTQMFGAGPALAPTPDGTRLRRRFRSWLELEWSGETTPNDVRWDSVLILHYRGPLSEGLPGPLPRLRQLRELRDASVPLFRALLTAPPPELGTIELHTPTDVFAGLIESARELPALETLVVHFLQGPPGQVLTDELLERHAWLDRLPGEGATVVFRLRR